MSETLWVCPTSATFVPFTVTALAETLFTTKLADPLTDKSLKFPMSAVTVDATTDAATTPSASTLVATNDAFVTKRFDVLTVAAITESASTCVAVKDAEATIRFVNVPVFFVMAFAVIPESSGCTWAEVAY